MAFARHVFVALVATIGLAVLQPGWWVSDAAAWAVVQVGGCVPPLPLLCWLVVPTTASGVATCTAACWYFMFSGTLPAWWPSWPSWPSWGRPATTSMAYAAAAISAGAALAVVLCLPRLCRCRRVTKVVAPAGTVIPADAPPASAPAAATTGVPPGLSAPSTTARVPASAVAAGAGAGVGATHAVPGGQQQQGSPAGTPLPPVEPIELQSLGDIPTVPTDAGELLAARATLLRYIHGLYLADFFVESSELFSATLAATRAAMVASVATAKPDVVAGLESFARELNGRAVQLPRTMADELLPLMADFDASDASWKQTSVSSGITTWYRSEEGSPHHAFKVAGVVHAPLFDLISLLYEMDLMYTWLPGIKASARAPCTRFSLFGQQVFNAPWPVADREACLWGYGGVAGSRVVVYFRDATPRDLRKCSEPDAATTLFDCPKKAVRASIRYGGFLLDPLESVNGEARTNVTAVFHMDPRIALHSGFLNFISKSFCFMLVKFMRTASKKVRNDPSSEFRRRVRTHRRVYGEIERRMVMYLGESRAKELGLAAAAGKD